MSVVLRPAGPDDAAACATILSDWVAETPWFPNLHSRAEDKGFVSRKIANGGVTVADRGGTTAGFLALEGDYVACLYVAARHRGHGVGRALLDVAKLARPNGFTLWTFQANTGARRFYAREGLEALRFTDGRENEERLPDVEFGWPGQTQKETSP